MRQGRLTELKPTFDSWFSERAPAVYPDELEVRVHDRERAKNHQQECEHRERVGPSQREADDPHIFSASPDDIRR